MHYRNGREARNGDFIVQLGDSGRIEAFGKLQNAVAGNDYCNGDMVLELTYCNLWFHKSACLCDCLHVDDVAEILKEKGLHKRPNGM